MLRIIDSDGRSLLDAARYGASGIVWDSLRTGPLAFARVALEGTTHRVIADGSGRFSFADVPPGRYSLRVDHARLDSLPEIARPRGSVLIEEGEPAVVQLGVPTERTIFETACPGLWLVPPGSPIPEYPWPGRGDGILSGVVVGTDGQPIAGAAAHVSWQAIRMDAGRINVRDVIPTATTDDEGRFTICGVPSDMPLSVWATVGESTSAMVETSARGRFAFAATILRR